MVLGEMVPGKKPTGKMPLGNCLLENCLPKNCFQGKLPSRKLPTGRLLPGELTPMKFLCGFFLISSFHFYDNFCLSEKSIFIQLIFYYKFVYSICLHYVFLSVYFWFSGMAYNVCHTYMYDQQCWDRYLPARFFYEQRFIQLSLSVA